jgi:hypothetical protein
MLKGIRRVLSAPGPLAILITALVAVALLVKGPGRSVVLIAVGGAGLGIIARRTARKEGGEPDTLPRSGLPNSPGVWKYHDAVFLKTSGRVARRWTQGKFRYDGRTAEWSYFWRPWQRNIAIPLGSLRISSTRVSDPRDLPVKPMMYTVLKCQDSDIIWQFAVPCARETEFTRIIRASPRPQ